jgi:pyridinium-3,5-biscarboxylic acid mononucleotide synthase
VRYDGAMNADLLRLLAEQLVAGELAPNAFLDQVAENGVAENGSPATADLGDAQIDLDRARRCGFPEVIFAQGKSCDAMCRIVERLSGDGIDVLATRVSVEQAAVLAQQFAVGVYNPTARTYRLRPAGDADNPASKVGRVAVVTAGTSDRPVAEEACETLDWMGVAWTLIQDIGVAGPQRLLEKLPEILPSDAVVVAAGMEGALPSVVGGHVACPVIAVPTSVGYGASFGGVAALLGMLNSCAANVTVVNIDAGFKAGYIAGLIARRANRGASQP